MESENCWRNMSEQLAKYNEKKQTVTSKKLKIKGSDKKNYAQ